MAIFKPTFFPALSYTLKKLYGRIQHELKLAKGCKYWFVDRMVNAKLDALDYYGTVYKFMQDKMIFNQIKQVIGGNIRLVVCFGDAIQDEILKFLKISLVVDIL